MANQPNIRERKFISSQKVEKLTVFKNNLKTSFMTTFQPNTANIGVNTEPMYK